MVEEELNRTRGEKSDLDRSLSNHDQEVNELSMQLSQLQQGFEDKEQHHSKKYVCSPFKMTFLLIFLLKIMSVCRNGCSVLVFRVAR